MTDHLTARPPSEIPLLTVDGVRKAYGGSVVLRELSLTVQRHQCVALIGASGSGKSTLLRCINLLEIVDDGTITLDGVDITDPRADPTWCARPLASCSSRSTSSRI